MNHVFISHCICDEDKQVLTDLKKKLTEHNITFNDLDKTNASQHLPHEILDSIKSSYVCVFIATSKSLESGWCRAEVGAFWGLSRNIFVYCPGEVPANIEKIMPPPIKTQLYISDLEALVCQIQNAQSNPLLYDDQIVVKYPRSKLTVKFGRIENQPVERNTLVVLSINEDFDLSCIQKSNTALGAYCSKIYGDAEQAINVIKEQIPHQREANEPVFIDSNTDARASIMLAPVVKSDPEAGNIASPGLIFEMVRRARKYMLKNNTKRLIMPLLGTGQANIDKSMSFVTTLLAIQQTEILKANNIDEVSVVIFQQSTSSVPEIEKSDVFAMLETLVANSVIKH